MRDNWQAGCLENCFLSKNEAMFSNGLRLQKQYHVMLLKIWDMVKEIQ
jgi:hypothetical protein